MVYSISGRRRGAQSRARQGSKRRSEEILEAALRLFSGRGYTAVSIKEIARVSKINSALIYYYFASKDHLFVEALKYSAKAASMQQHRGAAPIEDPVVAINFWFDANAQMVKPLGQMLRLMLDYRMSSKRSASVDRLIREFYEAEVGLLQRNIALGVKSGAFRPVDVAQTALFVSTHLDGLMVAASIRDDYDLQAGLRHTRRVLFAWLNPTVGARTKDKSANKRRHAARPLLPDAVHRVLRQ
jgi:TetR/AcrR family transcriptional regulator, upper aerobic nicotinate degradation pathway regulator